ncbi:MAG: right-handed parallel beta-helix repeat-containing protein [Euryarchaeota archaeon]|nr:right-handed parallel beta-helix repeat-containing protein [Euryarchaeota archaeon]
MNMLRQKMSILILVACFFLASTPTALCTSSPTIIYVAGDSSGDYICDGKSDQVQINQALNFVANNTAYSTVHLKGPFTYVIDDTILIGNNTTLEGDSSAVIKLANHVNWPSMKPLIQQISNSGNSNITVRGFEVDVNYDGNSEILLGRGYYNVMYFIRCTNVKVYDMYMHDGNGDGLRINTGKNIQFYNNTINKLGHDCLFALQCNNVEAWNNRITCRTNSALRISNSNNVKLHDNFIDSFHHWSAGGPGIQIEKGPDSLKRTAIVNDIEVYNNTISNSFGPGIWLTDGDSSSTGDEGKGIRIHNNIFYCVGTNPSINWVGGIVQNGFNGIFIENNVFDGCYGAAVYLMSPPKYLPEGGFKDTVRNNIIVNTQKRINDSNGTGYAVINDFPQTYNLVLQNNNLYNNVGGNYKNCTSTTDIYVNPFFADRKNHDYHLLSTAGRWNGVKWVKDKVSSPCIDAGYPYSDYSKEPEPNGNRINIGPDGNTIYASKSENTQTPICRDAGFSGEVTSENVLLKEAITNITAGTPLLNETKITTNVSMKRFPAIYGDRIVWQDYRNGSPANASWDIYMYDLSTSNETRITTNESWQENPAIYGDRIVWEDGRSGNNDIYLYSISSGKETRITNDESVCTNPAIYNDKIIWEERHAGVNHDICMYNISSRKELRITNGKSDNIHPAIYGDYIVWERSSGGLHDILMYTISTRKVTQITKNGKAYNPAIYGNRIVWEDHRLADKYDLSSSDIFKYDLSTHKETQISTSGRASSSAIYGDRIAWHDFRNGNDNIFMYDLSSSKEIQITTNKSEQEFPSIFGDRIVWQDFRDVPYKPNIYMCTVISPPAANFYASPKSGDKPFTVAFIDESTGSPATWEWNFGDGTTSTYKNPKHVYSKGGKYSVSLKVTNPAGNHTLTKSNYITVNSPKAPVAAFSASLTSGKAPLTVIFTDKSINNPTSWSWDFGDKSTSTVKTPTHKFSKAGKYTVKLTVKNSKGSNSVVKTSYIIVK